MAGTSSMPLISLIVNILPDLHESFYQGVTVWCNVSKSYVYEKVKKKKISKINKTLKNDNKTLNMNIATSIFLLLDQVVALPSVFSRKHQIGSSTLHFPIHYEDLKSTLR